MHGAYLFRMDCGRYAKYNFPKIPFQNFTLATSTLGVLKEGLEYQSLE